MIHTVKTLLAGASLALGLAALPALAQDDYPTKPISFVVPCHRVLGSNGKLCGYHWGLTRKRAILGWEAGLSEPVLSAVKRG